MKKYALAMIMTLFIPIGLYSSSEYYDLGITMKEEEVVESKSGVFVSLGSGISKMRMSGVGSYTLVDFNYMVGFNFYSNKNVGLRTYLSGDTALYKDKFYGFTGLNVDFLWDLFANNYGVGMGVFAGYGLGVGLSVSGIRIAKSTRHHGILNFLNAGVYYTASRDGRLELFTRFALKPAVDMKLMCALDFSCATKLDDQTRGFVPLIFGVAYTKVF